MSESLIEFRQVGKSFDSASGTLEAVKAVDLTVARGEWKLASERLDVDPRPTQSQGLWASFDATNLYIGWRGAAWGAIPFAGRGVTGTAVSSSEGRASFVRP